MCEKELRIKIAELSEYQAKIALYALCNSPPIIIGHLKDAVEEAQKYPRSEG